MAPVSRPRAKRDDKSALKRAARASIVVPAISVTLPRSTPVIDVASLDALVALAEKYESVIVEHGGAHGSTYLVWDNGMLFRYASPAAAPTDEGRGDNAMSQLRQSAGTSTGEPDPPAAPKSAAKAQGTRRKPRTAK